MNLAAIIYYGRTSHGGQMETPRFVFRSMRNRISAKRSPRILSISDSWMRLNGYEAFLF